MKVMMVHAVEMASVTLRLGDVVDVRPHEEYPNTYYVEGLPETELLLNEPTVFYKAQESAA